MKEADGITVLDTGSEDGSADLLRALGAQVWEEAVVPWRFDAARNRSLQLVPQDADICVCTDLDEVFRPGWRKAAEAAWHGGVNQLRYRYIWSLTPDGKEDRVFLSDKIHGRNGFCWVGAVHEILRSETVNTAVAEGVVLEHYPDLQKSRGQYLPLLELAVTEDPENDRNLHYLGREYFFCGRYDDAIRTLRQHLSLPTSQWRDERCASMRYIAQCFRMLGNSRECESWLLRAAAEAPWLREPWVELAEYLAEHRQWHGVCYAAGRALRIKDRPLHYISEGRVWGSLPYDLLSLGLYHTGSYRKAAEAVKQARLLCPEDGRLLENERLIRDRIALLNDHLPNSDCEEFKTEV